MKRFAACFFTMLVTIGAFAQDVNFARSVIQELASPSYHGRGYYKDGARKAADFLEKSFKGIGLEPVGEKYTQPFPIAINCIVGKPRVALGGKNLHPGTEFVVSRNSPTLKGTFPILVLNTEPAPLDSLLQVVAGKDLSETFVVTANTDRVLSSRNIFGAAGVVILSEGKLWWHVSNGKKVMDVPVLKIKQLVFDVESKTIRVNIKNKFYNSYVTENVAGLVRGTKFPDQYVLLTAHYDHLGRMGKEVYFPGAHDNASGTAMITDLARYFTENPPPVSVLFLAFAAEETGLDGSGYYVEHPMVPLQSTLFSMNLDIIGSGSTGIKVVNGKVLPAFIAVLENINSKNDYVKKIGKRGEAANSDHYHFYRKGVPSFFIYTTGKEYTEYHNLDDRAEDLPLTAYEGLFRLVRDFVEAFPIKN